MGPKETLGGHFLWPGAATAQTQRREECQPNLEESESHKPSSEAEEINLEFKPNHPKEPEEFSQERIPTISDDLEELYKKPCAKTKKSTQHV